MHFNFPVRAASVAAAVICAAPPPLAAGPYSTASDDPANPHDAPVPGFTGPHGDGKARIIAGLDDEGEPLIDNPGNYVNPLFFAWAANVVDYVPPPPPELISSSFSNPALALGEVKGDNFDVVSLGDMGAAAIAAGDPPGTITLELARPVHDLTGADFVVFENGYISGGNDSGTGAGGVFAELAHVEVSADGENFTRFPSVSLTPAAAGPFGSINATDLFNLAGKHVNSNGDSWGTPFDLASVGLERITHIRIVDIPGNGSFADGLGNPVYDPWKTSGSGGFDLEAIGGISAMMNYADWPLLDKLPADQRGMEHDPDGDGVPNLLEYAFARLPWLHEPAAGLPKLRMVRDGVDTFAELEFTRDERLADLTYEVQFSTTLAAGGWTGLARGGAGAPLAPLGGHAPVIVETSASPIASIGVLRKVTVRDDVPLTSNDRRFYRVKITSDPNP
ncbi:MAG: hypothetical protein MUF86_13315 [Akkermansiaceae bacterium]|nr:hypothetical protein [Akkermansiaceae bacterium]